MQRKAGLSLSGEERRGAGGRGKRGSPAPESDKHVCLGTQGWTLPCPALRALPGAQRVGAVEKPGDIGAWGEVWGRGEGSAQSESQ